MYPQPPVDQIHTRLIDALHGAMLHPGLPADHKSDYAGILNVLMRRQAKMQQQNPARPAAGPGGPVVEPGQPTPAADTSALLQLLFAPAAGLQHVPQVGSLGLQPPSLMGVLQRGPVY